MMTEIEKIIKPASYFPCEETLPERHSFPVEAYAALAGLLFVVACSVVGF